MDESYFESALKSLTKTQHKRRLLQILLALRKYINTPNRVKKLHTQGSLKYIVSGLQQDSRSIVDASLSILGNCSCLDTNCAKSLVQNHSILPALCSVYDKYNEDSIKGRIFRIVGNLGDLILCKYVVEKEPEIIGKTVEFLNDVAEEKEAENGCQPTVPTITMAIRLLRKMVIKTTVEPLLSVHEVLKAVGKVFIKYTSQWVEEKSKDCEIILNDVIKLIIVYSNHKHAASIVQLKNTGSGDAMDCLSKVVLKFPERIVKLVTNYLKNCLLKSDIPIVEICEKLMEGITSSKFEDDGTMNQLYLTALCKIVDESAAREEIRNANVIPFLVEILRGLKPNTEQSYEYCHYILSSIIMCKYDYVLTAAQIKSGIISVLTDILQWTYGKPATFKIRHKGRKRESNAKSRDDKKKFKKDLIETKDEFSLDWSLIISNHNRLREDRCASPSSSSDDMSSSPNSPNYPILIDNDDLSDSDNYSPVCSDTEETDHNECLSQEEDRTGSENEINDHVLMEKYLNKGSVQYMVRQEIHILFKWYTTLQPATLDLTNPELIKTLTKAATDLVDPFNMSFEVLLNILAIPQCLLPLMSSDYILMVYDLTLLDHGNDCFQCQELNDKARCILEKLKKLAESGGGKGEIAHNLLRSNNDERKQKLILSLPYIIRNKSILSKILLNCDGLEIFLNLLKNETKERIQEHCVRGLCEMASIQLKIKSPKADQTKPVRVYREKDYSIPESCVNVVTFKLDDGSTLKADRDFLSENCDYFNRLLDGDFKESHESEINLKNTDIRIFNLVLSLMNEDFTKGLLQFDDLNIALEAIALADKFILVELSVYLAECVEQILISSKTVPDIYQWSIDSGTNILRVESVAFALVGEVTSSERFVIFKRLFNLGYCDYLVDDIRTLMTRFLRQCA